MTGLQESHVLLPPPPLCLSQHSLSHSAEASSPPGRSVPRGFWRENLSPEDVKGKWDRRCTTCVVTSLLHNLLYSSSHPVLEDCRHVFPGRLWVRVQETFFDYIFPWQKWSVTLWASSALERNVFFLDCFSLVFSREDSVEREREGGVLALFQQHRSVLRKKEKQIGLICKHLNAFFQTMVNG